MAFTHHSGKRVHGLKGQKAGRLLPRKGKPRLGSSRHGRR
jgi:hypothetical protein